MTGKQIHSIVHRLHIVSQLRADTRTDLIIGREERAMRKYRASDTIVSRVYRDLGRWMTPAQNNDFDAAFNRVHAHRTHANAKRQARAA